MGSTALRQFLISLCDDTHWKYSVFWKLKHQTPLILTCEDGYYDDTKPEETWETKSFEGELEGCRIGLVVANMSRFHYAFGEGLVGEVACTGNHMWVSISSFFSREFESKLVPDWTDKWLLQIALGIKTILLVPVFPYGVIQLGSLEEVAENLSAVSLVKDRFNSYRKMTESIAFTSMGNSEFPSSTCKRVKYEKPEDFECDDSKTRSDQAIGSSSRGNNPETFEFKCPEEELGDLNLEFLEELLNEVNRYTSGDMEIQLFGSDLHLINEGGSKSSADELYSFIKADELSTSPLGKTNGFTEESCWVSYEDLADMTDPSWLSQRTESDYVSAAFTTNLFSGSSEDQSSSPSRSSNSPRQSCTTQPQVQSKEVSNIENLLAPCSFAGPSVLERIESSASLNAMGSTLTNEGPQEKGNNHTAKKLSSLKTSRPKHGITHRPRPRDRQLIQDRVKELRELIPNGSKCSIDGLLDRTIKHMLYLSTVSGQAQKLKGLAYPELYESRNRNSIESNGFSHNGTSWGFDCGTESPGCPIVVEDLELPGHMLIKVLCDDPGLFLEIAQLIRRLDLTILNGLLENRSNSIWADFVVEATKGFHRMEIFWPLLHLLQRKRSRLQS